MFSIHTKSSAISPTDLWPYPAKIFSNLSEASVPVLITSEAMSKIESEDLLYLAPRYAFMAGCFALQFCNRE